MISIKIKIASTIKDKIVGLIGKKEAEALMLKTRFGIHTFGLSFPLDILILNSNCEVVKVKANLMPNKLYFWNPIYKTVLELPAGTIIRKGIKIGDNIELVPVSF